MATSAQPFSLSNRVPNTTLRMPLNPFAYDFTLSNDFVNLLKPFNSPVAFTSPPGETNRLFWVEQYGEIVVVTNLAAPNRTVFLNIRDRVAQLPYGEGNLLGMAFHPGYQTNGFFYVFYLAQRPNSVLYNRLSRFRVSSENPNAGLTNSEVILINQHDEADNHNAGDLHFGPDGYLYVSLGDEGTANDQLNNSQTITNDFFSGILRIDVDKRPGSLPPNPHPASRTNYAIPPDNPFVGATNFNGNPIQPEHVRTEFWAVGLRNPWRMSFNQETGHLYSGDVGQAAREEINIIVKGGNYGWAFKEGTQPGPKSAPPDFASIHPIYEYPTPYRGAVIGGVVYYGDRLPGLNGAYIFGDYFGWVRALRYQGTNTTVTLIARTGPAGITCFGIDPANGDVLVGLYEQIGRLVPAVPLTLADTGAFADLATLTPHEGIVPYEVNLPFWSDGAEKHRWFYIPTNGNIQLNVDGPGSFPAGSVWIQHFELEMTNGVPESRRRLETRFLVRHNSGAYGVTYRWGDSTTNAMLVPEEGLDETLTINDGGAARTQVWRYPSRSECLSCHTSQAGFVLGFNAAQLNRDFTYPNGVTENQPRAYRRAGYFDPNTPIDLENRARAVAQLTNEAISVEQRVRSYLAVNCSQCHQRFGTGRGVFDVRLATFLWNTKLIDGGLIGEGTNTDQRVVVRGSLEHSMLFKRMASVGPSRMPPLGRSLVDTQATALISRWITNDLAGHETYSEWAIRHFGSWRFEGIDSDGDRAINRLEYQTGTDPVNPQDYWRIDIVRKDDEIEIVYPRLANRGFEVRWSTNVAGPYQFLNVPENRPFMSATNGLTRIPDAATNDSQRFYRVWVYEP